MSETGKTATEETKTAVPGEPAAGNATEQRLARIESLLEQQLVQNKKIARHRAILSFLMLCLVLVFAVGLFALNRTVSGAVTELPGTIRTVEKSARQLEMTLQDVSSLDFESMNEAIVEMDKGLASVDFDALNAAILDLQTTTEGLANFTRLFG